MVESARVTLKKERGPLSKTKIITGLIKRRGETDKLKNRKNNRKLYY